MRELLGFFSLLALAFFGLWVASYVYAFLFPILTHPIATVLFIAVFVLFAVRLVKASQR